MTARVIIVVTLIGMMAVAILALRDTDVLKFSDYYVTGLPVAVVPPEKKADVPAEPKSLTFVTYNVLVDKVAVGQRIPALFKLLKESNADVIALQEGTGWFDDLLVKEDWVKGYFRVARSSQCAGNLILSKYPVAFAGCQMLQSKQSRMMLFAMLKIGDRRMEVGTSHMESPLESDEIRARQLQAIFEKLSNAQDAIYLADFNMGDGEGAESAIPTAYHDVWKDVNPEDPGYTWNIEKSGMAYEGRFPGEPSRRLDRILVRSDVWKSSSAKIIGDMPLNPGKNDLFPSDHFGLTGSVTRN